MGAVARECLEKEADDRYQSVNDLLVDLWALDRRFTAADEGKAANDNTAPAAPPNVPAETGEQRDQTQITEAPPPRHMRVMLIAALSLTALVVIAVILRYLVRG